MELLPHKYCNLGPRLIMFILHRNRESLLATIIAFLGLAMTSLTSALVGLDRPGSVNIFCTCTGRSENFWVMN